MFMAFRTVARLRSMIARLIPPGHFLVSSSSLWSFLLFPHTSYKPQTATHECTFPFRTFCHLPLPSTYSLPSAHTRLPPTSHTNANKSEKRVCIFFLIIVIVIHILTLILFHTLPLNV